LALRAVVFDYGIVLTGPPDAALLRITGLPVDRFEPLYWADRPAYDEGKLTGTAFWQKFLRAAGLPPNQAMVEELNRWDQRLWTVENPIMLAWQLALKQRSLLTAILSNMGDDVLASVEREFTALMYWCGAVNSASSSPIRSSIDTRSPSSAPSPKKRSSSTTSGPT
jgi:putative hydrolase of the HAD superfamily